jgi:hypothetical protein
VPSLRPRGAIRGTAEERLVHGSAWRPRSGRLARQLLERLWVDATGPPLANARAQPRQDHVDQHPEDPGVDPLYPD